MRYVKEVITCKNGTAQEKYALEYVLNKEKYKKFSYLVGFPHRSVSKAFACNVGDPVSILGLGSSPGEGNGNPLQDSYLENPMNGEAWRATAHGVTRVRHDLALSFFSFFLFLFVQALTFRYMKNICPDYLLLSQMNVNVEAALTLNFPNISKMSEKLHMFNSFVQNIFANGSLENPCISNFLPDLF